MYRSKLVHGAVCAAVVLTIGGCGGADEERQDAAATEDGPAGQYDAGLLQNDGPPVDGPPTVGVSMTYHDWTTGEPVAGIECCLDGTANCETTGATGLAMLSKVPASSEVGITCTKAGYLTRYVQFTTGLTNVGSSSAYFSDSLLTAWAQAAGTTLDTTKAFIFAQGYWVDLQRTGISFDLTPASGVGPVYFDDVGEVDPTGTSTVGPPYALYVNVEPGDYIFAATSANGCVFSSPHGWEGATPGTLDVGARAGTLTGAFLLCQ